MKRLAILTGLTVLALLIGVTGTTLRPDKAEARPTDVISFNQDVCAAVVVADLLDAGEGVADSSAEAADLCYLGAAGLLVPAHLNALAEILDGADIAEAEDATLEGAVDNPDTYSVLVDYSAAQLGADGSPVPGGQGMWVLTTVTNDDPVHLDADEGVWLSTGFTSSQTDCEPSVAVGIEDEDCDNDGAWGDGVVVEMLIGNGVADLGDAIITATQSGIDVEMDYTVVGPPDYLTLSATKGTIQEGAADEDCALVDFTSAIAKPQISGLMAEVVDEDGTALTGIQVAWGSSDNHNVHFALVQNGPDQGEQTVNTISLSSGGVVAAPNLGCGGDTGMATATAAVLEWDGGGLVPTNIDDETDVTVIGVPASMTLNATPPAMVCDGINSSVVTATLRDSLGNLVADGTPVHFSVQGPAVVNPIWASTIDGVASTTVTGLSGIVVMLPVSVTSGDLEASIGVACAAPPPPSLIGDVNCDERVSMVDAMLIAQLVAGLIDELPCGVTP